MTNRNPSGLAAVDFIAHVIYGTMFTQSPIGARREGGIFGFASENRERIDARLGDGAVDLLFGHSWTSSLKKGPSDSTEDRYRGEFFTRALFYLAESLRGDQRDGLSINAGGVAALAAGRRVIGTGNAEHGARTVREIDARYLDVARDGTIERLGHALRVTAPGLEIRRARKLAIDHHSVLPAALWRNGHVEAAVDPDVVLNVLAAPKDGVRVTNPLGATPEWVEQLTAAAKLNAASMEIDLPHTVAD